MKLHVHQHTMVIYIQNKFNDFFFICYLVMDEGGKADGQRQAYIYPQGGGGGGGVKSFFHSLI